MTVRVDNVEAAIAAELRLLDPAVRRDAGAVETLLAPDFTEIGQSGRVWSRDDAILALHDSPDVATEPMELTGRAVGDRLVVVSYATTGSSGPPVRRSTLWRETDHGWQAVFHQATPSNQATASN